MMRSIVFAAAVSAAGFTFAAPAAAQTSIGAQCLANPAACAQLVAAEIAQLEAAGLSGAALDNAISQIASEVFTAAQSTSVRSEYQDLAAAIRTASSSMENNQAAAGLNQAAAVVNSGRASESSPDAFGLAPDSNAGTPQGPADPASPS